MNKKKVCYAIKYDGTVVSKMKHGEEYLADLLVCKGMPALVIRIPAKIKGIVRSTLLHFIYNTLTEKFKYKYYKSNQLSLNVSTREIDDGNDKINCFLAFEINDIFEYLYEFIEEFDCKIYSEVK